MYKKVELDLENIKRIYNINIPNKNYSSLELFEYLKKNVKIEKS